MSGDMFRPLLGHLQALWENRSKRYLGNLQALQKTDARAILVIFRPSEKNRSKSYLGHLQAL